MRSLLIFRKMDTFFANYSTRILFNKTFVGHPERTKYAKLFAVEQSRRRREQQKVEVHRKRCAEEIYERLPIAFQGLENCFVCTNAKEGRGVGANIAHREIRPCFASVALRASQGRLFAPKLRMTAGGVLRYAFIADRRVLATARSHSRSDITL